MEILSRKPSNSWIMALILSGVLNILFFYIMYILVSHRPAPVKFPEYVGGVELVRVKQSRPRTSSPPPPPHPPEKEVFPLIHNMAMSITTKFSNAGMMLKIPHPNMELLSSTTSITDIDIPSSLLAPPSIKPVAGIFKPSQLDRPLMVIEKIPPLYPMRARMLGIEGWVKIKFLVDEKGSVRNIQILASHPPGVFDQVTRDAVSKWKFQVPTVDGNPVRVEIITTIRFKLD